LTFREAQCRLLEDLRHRIHNGDLTERGLARISGISQPHVHNVLKGIRFLSPGSLDLILKSLNYSILDFSTQPELETCTVARFHPYTNFDLRLKDSAIGPRMPWSDRATSRRKFSLPADLENSPANLVLARVRLDTHMDPDLTDCDLAVLDTSARWCSYFSPRGIYVISLAGQTILRYVRCGKSCIYLAASDNLDDPLAWQSLPMLDGEITELVKGKVIWFGREEQLHFQTRQCGRFLTDATSS